MGGVSERAARKKFSWRYFLTIQSLLKHQL